MILDEKCRELCRLVRKNPAFDQICSDLWDMQQPQPNFYKWVEACLAMYQELERQREIGQGEAPSQEDSPAPQAQAPSGPASVEPPAALR